MNINAAEKIVGGVGDINQSPLLLFDVDTQSRSDIKNQLEKAGYRINAYDHLPKLIEALQDCRPECVVAADSDALRITDLAKNIKAIDAYVRLVVLSSDADVTQAVEAMRLGADDLMEKPVIAPILLDKINRLLS